MINNMKNYNRQIKDVTQKDVDRFWGHVDKNGTNGCWNWKLKSSSHGYGLFSAGGMLHRTSRFAYIHHGGLYSNPIEGDYRITTSCQNKKCCNPDHLTQASQQVVFDRMRANGQITVGSKHKMAKLTEPDIVDIRARYTPRSETDAYGAIGLDYGVSTGCIRDIIIRKTWRHV